MSMYINFDPLQILLYSLRTIVINGDKEDYLKGNLVVFSLSKIVGEGSSLGPTF